MMKLLLCSVRLYIVTNIFFNERYEHENTIIKLQKVIQNDVFITWADVPN